MVAANLRVYSPPNNYSLRDDAVVFLIARAQFPPTPPVLLDTIYVSAIPGDPEDEDYKKGCPEVHFLFVFVIGTSSGVIDTETTSDGVSCYFPYAARQTSTSLPAHALSIKVNGVYCLIRNLSIDRGLTKNTHVLVKALGRRLITIRGLHGLDNAPIHTRGITMF